jgi:hypothetical protein
VRVVCAVCGVCVCVLARYCVLDMDVFVCELAGGWAALQSWGACLSVFAGV